MSDAKIDRPKVTVEAKRDPSRQGPMVAPSGLTVGDEYTGSPSSTDHRTVPVESFSAYALPSSDPM
jgi:hypothetical protein